MKAWVMAGVVAAVLLIVGLPALAVALGSGSDEPVGPPSFSVGQTAGDHADHADDDSRGGKADKGEKGHDARGHRYGPPPWAHGHRADKPGKGALDAWKRLTPAQKAKRMAALSQQHADGMTKWADCVAAGKTGCERPWPPGLAKRSR
jgi:hypothetical protein